MMSCMIAGMIWYMICIMIYIIYHVSYIVLYRKLEGKRHHRGYQFATLKRKVYWAGFWSDYLKYASLYSPLYIHVVEVGCIISGHLNKLGWLVQLWQVIAEDCPNTLKHCIWHQVCVFCSYQLYRGWTSE